MVAKCGIIPPPELRALSKTSNALGVVRLFIHLGLLVFTGWLVAASNTWMLGFSLIMLGIVQAALFAPLHETIHFTAFKSRRVNAVVGWLVACPGLRNWHLHSAFHVRHHHYTQIPGKDPELDGPLPATRWEYVFVLSGLSYWRARICELFDGCRGDLSSHSYVPAARSKSAISSIRTMVALLVLVCSATTVVFGFKAVLMFWIVPRMLGQPFMRAYILAEHAGCSLDDNGLTNTRTVLTNGLVRLLTWNMSFHAEHHLYPSIPFHRLPAAHKRMKDRLHHVDNGYLQWNARYLRSLQSSPAVDYTTS